MGSGIAYGVTRVFSETLTQHPKPCQISPGFETGLVKRMSIKGQGVIESPPGILGLAGELRDSLNIQEPHFPSCREWCLWPKEVATHSVLRWLPRFESSMWFMLFESAPWLFVAMACLSMLIITGFPEELSASECEIFVTAQVTWHLAARWSFSIELLLNTRYYVSLFLLWFWTVAENPVFKHWDTLNQKPFINQTKSDHCTGFNYIIGYCHIRT